MYGISPTQLSQRPRAEFQHESQEPSVKAKLSRAVGQTEPPQSYCYSFTTDDNLMLNPSALPGLVTKMNFQLMMW